MIDKHIPILWQNNEHRFLSYTEEYWRDYEVKQYKNWIDAGHLPDILAFNVHRFREGLPDWCTYLTSLFKDYDCLNFAMHQCKPGHYMPSHYDHYTYYVKTYNCNINDIVRIIVFLEDWQDGHLLFVENRFYSNWKAGDAVSWQGQTLHGLANLGTVDRYTLQVTGILKKQR